MWTRKELKTRGKTTFKRNYWKCVLISLVLLVVAGIGGSGAGGRSMDSVVEDRTNIVIKEFSDIEDADTTYDDAYYDDGELFPELNQSIWNLPWIAVIIFAGIFLIIFLVILAVAMALAALVCNPVEVGCRRFYIRNLREKAIVGNIGYAFDVEYKNIVKIMFFRDLYLLLWTLLFVIPGNVKNYEYRMVPYILAENPQMPKNQVFVESRQMMDGQKWSTFLLDLSFLGWDILGVMTGGILTLFYVQPYKDATGAALYERLRYGIPREMQGAYYEERQAERQTGNRANQEERQTENWAEWQENRTENEKHEEDRAKNQAEQQESPAENEEGQGGETIWNTRS